MIKKTHKLYRSQINLIKMSNEDLRVINEKKINAKVRILRSGMSNRENMRSLIQK